jgi:hypothetical protein
VKRGAGAGLASVSLDGVGLGAQQVGKATQVNPGPHVVEATAAGKEPFKEVIELAEAENKTIEVKMKEAGGAVPKASASAAPPPTETASSAPPPPAERTVIPFVVGGVGVASLIASGVFFLMRSSAASELDDKCQGEVCPANAKSTGDRGKTMTLLGNITLGLGIVGVGAGVTLYILEGQKTGSPEKTAFLPVPKRIDLRPFTSPTGGGASLVGSFLAYESRTDVPISLSERLRHHRHARGPLDRCLCLSRLRVRRRQVRGSDLRRRR